MIETIHLSSGEIIRTMTPVEYQKAHLENDHRMRRTEDLRNFMAFLVAEMVDYPLVETNPDERENLIQSYLNCDRDSVAQSRKL